MYASLDRVDIVSRGQDGRLRYIQTDHRPADEIAQAPELSTIFAVTRILNARRMAEEEGEQAEIIYIASSPPPGFLLRAIAAAGGRAQIGLGEPEPLPTEAPDLDDLLQAAFAGLAQRTAAAHGAEVSLAGLARVEQALTAEPPDAEDNESGYWTTVVSLGALAGEIIRSANGGRWAITDRGSLPLVLATRFNGGDATVNPLGKAIKLLANGDGDSVVALVEMIISKP